VAEGARLESVFTRKGNVGSNPTLSASFSNPLKIGASRVRLPISAKSRLPKSLITGKPRYWLFEEIRAMKSLPSVSLYIRTSDGKGRRRYERIRRRNPQMCGPR
jgi:hypothetical protein